MNSFNDDTQWQKLKTGIVNLAKAEVLSRFNIVKAEIKQDGSLLTEADTQMQIQTQAFLKTHWPNYAFLGEESSPEAQSLALASEQGCWILDPVDGTSNFASGIAFFSVSLALVVKGQVIAGLIYDPYRDELFGARQGLGAELNNTHLVAKTSKIALKQCIGIIDFKRLPTQLAITLSTTPPFASQRSFGSVALDWCWIAAGRGQVYCHGAQNIWDYAAGWLILNEAGGKSAALNGESVLVPTVTKRSAVAATTPELFAEWQFFLNNLDF